MGAECIWIGEGAASLSVISPNQYREFEYPYEKILVQEMRKRGIYSIIHICGDINESMDMIADTGVDSMDIDYPVSLRKAKEEVGDRICLRGNIDPRELKDLCYDEIHKLSNEKIKQAGLNGGFMLSTGCLLARDTPKENVQAMIQACMDHKL
jgi:uroporphyrinogen decarboxylase